MQIEERSLQKFDETVSIMQKYMGKRGEDLSKDIGRTLTATAIKVTPIETHEYTTYSSKGTTLKKNYQYYKWFPTVSTLWLLGKIRKIKNKGFAKSGWARAKSTLSNTPQGAPYGMPAKKFGDAKVTVNLRRSSVTLHNSVPYIEQLNQGSKWNQAYWILSKAVNQTRGWLQRRIKKIGVEIKEVSKL